MSSAGSGSTPEHDEVEVKVPCRDLSDVRRRLEAGGAAPLSPRHFESNDLYDDAEKRLSSQGRTIRLRRAGGRATLTYKGKARFQGGIKSREERETEVGDPAETEGILAGVGLARRFRYEKYREEWRFVDCTVALDETPIGSFVEVEGDPPAIRRVLKTLGLDFSSALPYSYARLYMQRRHEEPTLPADMVFPTREGGAP
ncbi:MAG: class IV adenylate cyclase [Acidobacteria bacterium]|nr:class IV adenylate cyclase [Acidobacteriota bacterium]MCA1611896.1 class IV adenylate cyclase [Acidobacteriota bacterium]